MQQAITERAAMRPLATTRMGMMGSHAALDAGWPLIKHRLRPRQPLFLAGQDRGALYYVHAGCLKTRVISADGRERITGFPMRGEILGLEALDLGTYACDAIALDVGEAWELPCRHLDEAPQELQAYVTRCLARELRRDWYWMLDLSTLSADARVALFLADLSDRLAALGYSAHQLMLRMTRAEIGSFLGLTLETVTRALGRLQARGLVSVDGRVLELVDLAALRGVPASDDTVPVCH